MWEKSENFNSPNPYFLIYVKKKTTGEGIWPPPSPAGIGLNEIYFVKFEQPSVNLEHKHNLLIVQWYEPKLQKRTKISLLQVKHGTKLNECLMCGYQGLMLVQIRIINSNPSCLWIGGLKWNWQLVLFCKIPQTKS